MYIHLSSLLIAVLTLNCVLLNFRLRMLFWFLWTFLCKNLCRKKFDVEKATKSLIPVITKIKKMITLQLS
jgi:hypothetical protein